MTNVSFMQILQGIQNLGYNAFDLIMSDIWIGFEKIVKTLAWKVFLDTIYAIIVVIIYDFIDLDHIFMFYLLEKLDFVLDLFYLKTIRKNNQRY